MVEKFKYSASQVTLLFLINYLFNWLFAERIGKIIHVFGEKKSLTFEYVGLIIVFISYGIVTNAYVAAFLYVIDHMFFALALAINTYFQKIADPKDIASSAGVSFTINHIAAIFVPVLLGFLWIYSNSLVFFIGAFFALLSLIATQFIPSNLKEIKPVIYIEVNPDRTVKSSKVVNKEKLNDPSFRTAAEAAMRAVNNPECSPLLLPVDKYEEWKEINFTFDFSWMFD